METITQPEPTVLLQCEVPVSLMKRVRIMAAKRNSRAIKSVVIDALEAFVPQEDGEPEQAVPALTASKQPKSTGAANDNEGEPVSKRKSA